MKLVGESGGIPVKPFEQLDVDVVKRYIFVQQFVDNALVLDAGCGYGCGTDYLARSKSHRVIGIDHSDSAIAYAKQHYRKHNLEFQVMDVTSLTFDRGIFDVVVSFEVIEHLHQYHKYLSEIHRVLKPGGIYAMSTPNKKFRPRPDSSLPTWKWHVKEFFKDELSQLLASYFHQVQILGMHIINPYFRKEQQEMESRMKSGLRGRLISIAPITLIRLVPFRLKLICTGMNNYLTGLNISASSELSCEDVEISEREPEEARDLIAVCKKQ